MIYNLWKTAAQGQFIPDEKAQAPALQEAYQSPAGEHWHRRMFEWKPMRLLFWSLIVILIGGIVEMVPTFLIKSNIPTIANVKPLTPLELEGRDIYIREGCNNCHSQMVRPFRSETERYGEYAKAGEFVYDHPFLWGSKRTGPDLLRVGGKYPDSWHFNHMLDPESISPGTIMPPYPWLIDDDLNTSSTAAKISAMRKLGVPYADGYEAEAVNDLNAQAQKIAAGLKSSSIEVPAEKEIIALIAYLQRLGTDIQQPANAE